MTVCQGGAHYLCRRINSHTCHISKLGGEDVISEVHCTMHQDVSICKLLFSSLIAPLVCFLYPISSNAYYPVSPIMHSFITHPLPISRCTSYRLHPRCATTPPEPDTPSFDQASLQALRRRLAVLRDKEERIDRRIASNWRQGKYRTTVVASVGNDYVRKLAVNGGLVVMGTAAGSVVLSHLRTGLRLCCAHVHTGQVTAVQYRDGVVASAGSSDKEIALWRIHEYEKGGYWRGRARGGTLEEILPPPRLRVGRHEDLITALALDGGKEKVYSASVDGTVHVTNLESGMEVLKIRVGEPVLSMKLTEKGYLLLGCASGRVVAYQAERGLYLLSIVCHPSNVTALDFCDETEIMVTGDSSGNLAVWSLGDARRIGDLPNHSAAVMSLKMDAYKVVSASREGAVAISMLNPLRRQYSIHGFTKYLACVTFDKARLFADGTNDIVVCHRFDEEDHDIE